MEPTNVKPDPLPDDELEAWLRRDAALAPLPDNGFSARVLVALPTPVTKPYRLRAGCCALGAALGGALAALHVATPGNPLGHLPDADLALTAVSEQLASPAMGLALAVTAASLIYAFWGSVRRWVRI